LASRFLGGRQGLANTHEFPSVEGEWLLVPREAVTRTAPVPTISLCLPHSQNSQRRCVSTTRRS
jgi:hypothetical protein